MDFQSWQHRSGPRSVRMAPRSFLGGALVALVVVLAIATGGCASVAGHVVAIGKSEVKAALPRNLVEAQAAAEASMRLIESVSAKSKRVQVKLSDLGADMFRFEANPKTNFLRAATDVDGRAVEFTYVVIGDARFDALSKEVAASKALIHQSLSAMRRLSELTGVALHVEVGLDDALHAAVSQALGHGEVPENVKQELREVREVASSCAHLLRSFKYKVKRLESRARRLVNAKTIVLAATHPQAVSATVVASIKTLVASLELAQDIIPIVASFGRVGGVDGDDEEGQMALSRAELASLMYDPPEMLDDTRAAIRER